MSAANLRQWRGDAFLIVKGASGFRNSAERPVIVFQCYLDDSGTSGLPIVTMAGFVAHMHLWEELEPKFDEVLERYGVPILHTKEFHDTKGSFAGWSKLKKRTFAEELFTVAHGKMLGLSMSTRKRAWAEEQKETGQLPSMSAYGVCFSAILMQVVTEPQLGKHLRETGVSFLVESGNKNNAEIEQLFHSLTKMPQFKGCLRSISFINKDACRAIQVADFFAFYSRRYMRDIDRFGGKLSLPSSPYHETIRRHVPIWERGATSFLKGPVLTLDDVPALR